MRTILCLLFLFSCYASAQVTVALHPTAPVRADSVRENSTASPTTWDSVYLGTNGIEKWVTIRNDGTGIIFVALQNDTATASGHMNTVKNGEVWTLSRTSVAYIRTRSNTGGTQARRVQWGWGNIK